MKYYFPIIIANIFFGFAQQSKEMGHRIFK